MPRPLSAVRGETTHLLRQLQVVGVLLSVTEGERRECKIIRWYYLQPLGFVVRGKYKRFISFIIITTGEAVITVSAPRTRSSPGPSIDLTCLVECMIYCCWPPLFGVYRLNTLQKGERQ